MQDQQNFKFIIFTNALKLKSQGTRQNNSLKCQFNVCEVTKLDHFEKDSTHTKISIFVNGQHI